MSAPAVDARALAIGLALSTLATAGVLGVRRSPRAGLGFAGLYLPQALVLAWIVGTLSASRSGPAASTLLVVAASAYALVLFHRLTTYAFPLPPSRFDLALFVPVHVVQATLFLELFVWPASRLAPASTGVDLAAAIGPLALSAIALATTHRAPRVVELDVPVARLARPVRVAQISDLHVGPYLGAARLRDLDAQLRALAPDLVAMTGDFLTLRSERDYAPLLDFVRALAGPGGPPLGVLACLGNHDVAEGVKEPFVSGLRAAGARCLVDEAEVVGDGSRRLRVVGLDWRSRRDRAGYRAALDALLGGADRAPVLLLCHDPSAFDALASGFEGLMLAGHLHGGQIGLTSLGVPVSVLRLFGVRDQGLFRARDAALYVHRGTGVYGFPFRLGVPAEIALITLRPAPIGPAASKDA